MHIDCRSYRDIPKGDVNVCACIFYLGGGAMDPKVKSMLCGCPSLNSTCSLVLKSFE